LGVRTGGGLNRRAERDRLTFTFKPDLTKREKQEKGGRSKKRTMEKFDVQDI